MIINSSLTRFLRALWQFDAVSLSYNLLLNIAAAAFEGIGFMALLPLLKQIHQFRDDNLPAPDAWAMPAYLAEWLRALPADQRLLAMLCAFFGLIGLQSLLVTYREQHSPILQLRFVDHMRMALFRALAESRWRFLALHHSSEFVSVLTNDLQRVGIGCLFFLQLISQLVIFPVYFTVAFAMSPVISVMAMLMGVLMWWGLRSSSRASRQNGIEISRANKNLSNDVQEFMGGLKLIKIHGEAEGYMQRFSNVMADLSGHLQAFYVIRSRLQSVYRLVGALALAVLTYVSIVWLHSPPETLLVLIAVFARLLPQVAKVHVGFQQIWNMLPAFDNWLYWLDACREQRESLDDNKAARTLRDGIVFNNVRYSHPQSRQVCSVPALFIPARKTTVVTGPSGSGKTTFLDLLSGLQRPDCGSIAVDGELLHSQAGWRRMLAYVPQDCAIFDGSVRDNLNWGANDMADTAFWRALEQAAAGDFVRNLPKGLDTWVGERGVRLSGGEKQRLALARALLRQPELLVLDEATSALDSDNQQLIFEAIRALKGQLTVVIVTHHYYDIRHAVDGYIRVEQGSVGTWQAVDPSAENYIE
ncbi:ABC transporter ATP-binding protein/permease [Methylomonas sp. SURF-2]|uniref:ABC transporter ATP-binding protein/permease n=1 Tax=Methylomonas subterranea TaxID=2952225 RepID=A0ABT1TJZ7_9GAMM|nr:ABC transporter ATP-binding protein [Methylomonas sp. SURF-2]MCQ8105049.1 ABC transporter ATP-binding protein/permease [Methylomonas sp. SURF-2]